MNTTTFRTITTALLVSAAFGASSAWAADCAEARSPTEKMVCGNPTLQELNDQLAVVYQRVATDNPQATQHLSNWIRNSREKCDNVDCLITAYRAEIQAIGALQATRPAASPQLPVVANADSKPAGLQIDATVFLGGETPPFSEAFWTDPSKEAFGKRATDWTDQDFQTLEQALRDQIGIQQDRLLKPNHSSSDEYLFANSKLRLENAIAAIPQYKSWVGSARERARVREAQLLEQERQRQADELKRQQEETLRQAEIQRQQDEKSSNNRLIIALLAVAAAVGGWIWNKFIRNRCPNCKSSSFDRVGETETNRWQGTKQVTEKHSRGTNTRHVQTTYVTRLFAYRCKACQHEWTKERKEELGSGSNFDRFISGY